MNRENGIEAQREISEPRRKEWKWTKLPWVKICLDVILFLTAAIPVHGFYIYDAVPYQRGFFCNDESIRHPYKEDTVSSSMLYQVGFTVPCFMILLNELYEVYKNRWQIHTGCEPLKNLIFDLVWKLQARISVFLFGSYINEIVTNVTKIVIGRLRPCFIDVCRPDIDCSIQGRDPYTYIIDFTCTGNDTEKIQDARKSFPSGHSTFSFYVMIYLVIYLHFCMTFKPSRFLKPSLQLAFLMLAWFTSMSRITDYKHHPTDVAVGIILGSTIALGTVYFISDFYPKPSDNSKVSLIRNQQAEHQQDVLPYRNTPLDSKL